MDFHIQVATLIRLMMREEMRVALLKTIVLTISPRWDGFFTLGGDVLLTFDLIVS